MPDPLAPTASSVPGESSPVSVAQLRTHCLTCSMREMCLPVGLAMDELKQVDAFVAVRKKLSKGERLYSTGQPFSALYAVRVGSLKTVVPTDDGREQVAGYHMRGEIIGLDGIGLDRHGCDAVALEDSEACVLPFGELESLARLVPALQRNLHRFLSREIARDHGLMLMLGSLRTEERLATFLLNLSERYARRGYSPVEFVLRMTREEIGSYMGLTLETVSRLFSRFQRQGMIQVQGRTIRILDIDALRRVCGAR